MPRSLVQALAGVPFPSDRARLVDYARTNDASPRTLRALEALPDGPYPDLTAVLTALPSKNEQRRSAGRPLASPPRPGPAPAPAAMPETSFLCRWLDWADQAVLTWARTWPVFWIRCD
jgi:hypothetical protein